MTFLEWRDEFTVNNDEIDQQHKELVDLLNCLHEEMKGKRLTEVMGPMLDRVIDHTRRHFATEEDAMLADAYPGYETHRTSHRALIQQVEKLKARYTAGNLILSNEVLEFLKEWLVGHMKEADKEYGRYVARHNGRHPAGEKHPPRRHTH